MKVGKLGVSQIGKYLVQEGTGIARSQTTRRMAPLRHQNGGCRVESWCQKLKLERSEYHYSV